MVRGHCITGRTKDGARGAISPGESTIINALSVVDAALSGLFDPYR